MCGEALFWLLAAQGGLGDRPIAAFVAQLTGRGQGFLRVPGKARGAFPLADESVTSGPQKTWPLPWETNAVQADAARTAPSFGGTSRPWRRTHTWVNSTPSRKMSAE